MNIKRFLARDMRTAMREIREDLGPDAVILSTRRLAEGVEVCAAIDREGTNVELATPVTTAVAALPTGPANPAAPTAATDESRDASTSMSAELRSLRVLLERQVTAFGWNDFSRREPIKAGVLADFAELELARDVALDVLGELPADLSVEQAQRLPYRVLARRIITKASPLNAGGIVAVVGPVGAGKTTTLAKLAARWTLQHDPNSIAMVSSDDERIGSSAQLRTLGRLLGVATHEARSALECAARLDSLREKKLVLIDTSGLVARDRGGIDALTALRAVCPKLRIVVVLPTSAQYGVIEAATAQLLPLQPESCVLTRLDEATSLGGVLSVLARSRLPVFAVSDGPRIPEDLRPIQASELVTRAVTLARSAGSNADDVALARRYGGILNEAGRNAYGTKH